jgi:hypothetical protein
VDDFPLSPTQDDYDNDNDEHEHRHRRPQIPTIPDLRFEHSYLRSLKNCLHIQFSDAQTDSKNLGESHHWSVEGSEYEKVEHRQDGSKGSDESSEPMVAIEVAPAVRGAENLLPTFKITHIDWRNVLWITTRDQVIMPFLQGMVWGVAGTYLTPLSKRLFGKWSKSNLNLKDKQAAASEKLRQKMGSFDDGEGAQWLRRWAKGVGIAHTDSGASGR